MSPQGSPLSPSPIPHPPTRTPQPRIPLRPRAPLCPAGCGGRGRQLQSASPPSAGTSVPINHGDQLPVIIDPGTRALSDSAFSCRARKATELRRPSCVTRWQAREVHARPLRGDVAIHPLPPVGARSAHAPGRRANAPQTVAACVPTAKEAREEEGNKSSATCRPRCARSDTWQRAGVAPDFVALRWNILNMRCTFSGCASSGATSE